MAEEQKFIYRVKPGYSHGAKEQYGPGAKVELTAAEAKGFLDKLELVGLTATPAQTAQGGDNVERVTTPPTGTAQTGAESDSILVPFNVVNATVDEVLAAVQVGKITASDALIAEQQGSKQRATLLKALTDLVEATSQSKQE